MNVRTICIVSGISAALLGGACSMKLNLNQNYDDTKCAGYLGCSAGKSFGITTTADAGTIVADTVTVNSGCGMPLSSATSTTVAGSPKGYTQYTVMGTGLTLAGTLPAKKGARTFWVRVPADYDPTHHYRLVYLGQGCGGYDSANTATFQLYSVAQGGDEEAIYVAIDLPTDMANMDCYDNEDGPKSQEGGGVPALPLLRRLALLRRRGQDLHRGYSTGGWLSNMWGCYFAGDGEHPWNGVVPAATTSALTAGTSRSESIDASTTDGALMSDGGAATDGAATDGAATEGGAMMSGATDAGADVKPFVPAPGARMFAPQFHIRGQAAVSGGEPPNNPPCNGSVAGMWIHSADDNSNPISGSQKALARVLKMNRCENSRTMPWHPEVAVFNSVCTSTSTARRPIPSFLQDERRGPHGATPAGNSGLHAVLQPDRVRPDTLMPTAPSPRRSQRIVDERFVYMKTGLGRGALLLSLTVVGGIGCKTQPYCASLAACGGDLLAGQTDKVNMDNLVDREWSVTKSATCEDQLETPPTPLALVRQPPVPANVRPPDNVTADWCSNITFNPDGSVQQFFVWSPPIPLKVGNLVMSADPDSTYRGDVQDADHVRAAVLVRDLGDLPDDARLPRVVSGPGAADRGQAPDRGQHLRGSLLRPGQRRGRLSVRPTT